MAHNQSFARSASPEFPLGLSYYSAKDTPRAPVFLHQNNIIEFTFVQAGQVEICLHAQPCILQPGDIHIINPGDAYTLHSLSYETRYIHLWFSPKLLDSSTRHVFQTRFVEPLSSGVLRMPRLVRPGDGPYDNMRWEFDRLDRNKEGTEEYTFELYAVAVSLCAALVPYCTTVTQTEQSARSTSDIVVECLNYARIHYARSITLEQLAEHVHLHPNYLCAIFKRATGLSFFEHLTRFRVHRAARSLRSTSCPISEIAENCGFHSPSFFCRKFTQYYGMSPSAYRKHFSREVSSEHWL
ncbi:MAG: helix-turn-helix transcriptional regulator [Oscillospiraceae bacterium]|nr:helix-turn-helix transcriptional regulator [Oscillospiraceae bacterium]